MGGMLPSRQPVFALILVLYSTGYSTNVLPEKYVNAVAIYPSYVFVDLEQLYAMDFFELRMLNELSIVTIRSESYTGSCGRDTTTTLFVGERNMV